ncbi:putative protodermal factor 1 [Helianthus annuus]|nr:putative protodermal factor 1 [Helianthus annuus]
MATLPRHHPPDITTTLHLPPPPHPPRLPTLTHHPLLLTLTHPPPPHQHIPSPLLPGQKHRQSPVKRLHHLHTSHIYPSLVVHASNFWKGHQHLLSDLLTWWRTTFGRGDDTPGLNMNFQEALSNTRTDGIGALYREGAASLLNSMVNKNFPFTTSDVQDSFLAALRSNKAAAAQAEVFKLANEGRLKQRV